ncbi:hypothetical protein ACFL0O_12190 [Thermodesulfobacteriota bacterium]
MNPILCDLDLLKVVPYKEGRIRIGDVVLFFPPGEEEAVVHRIVRISPKGIRTRGDNSLCNDPWQLKPSTIAGKVVAVRQGAKQRKITGGRAGLVVARWARLVRAFDQKISWLLHPIYHYLSRSGIMHRILPSRWKIRTVIFKANGHNHTRLLLGERVVGRYNIRHGRWQIQRPFRLFVDETSLPK